MSLQLTKEDVLFRQRILKASDLYADKLDGIWGKNTNKAEEEFTSKSRDILDATFGPFDTRSEICIMSLVLKAQWHCRSFIGSGKQQGFDVRVLSGTRTYHEQAVIYAQGRTMPGIIVTHAHAGESLHNFGTAWDIGLFKNGSYIKTEPEYVRFKEVVLVGDLRLDIEWGGDWIHNKDAPHYQLRNASTEIAKTRLAFESGEEYYV